MTRYHEKVFAYGAKALDRCLEGIHVPTVVHLCYGYPGGAGTQHEYEYPELLAELMKTKIRFGGFGVEFARSNYDPALLGAWQRPHRHVRLCRPQRHAGAARRAKSSSACARH